jgi:AraC family transcriptional regulator of adaptative response / DNA-3-methyladenine glycosylase II
VEVVTDTTWLRAIDIDGVRGIVEVGPADRPHHLRARIDLPLATGIWPTMRRLRRLFDLDADPARIQEHLERQPRLRALVRRTPGLRIPGCWDPFELALRAVLGQQISVAAATTLAGRLAARWGEPLPQPRDGLTHAFPRADALVRARLESIGLPRSRAQTLRAVAQATRDGSIVWDDVTDAETIRSQLRSIRGIGDWTIEYIALRALREPDAFPASDLGLRQALGTADRAASAADVLRHAEPWRPWRGYAALHLWNSHAIESHSSEGDA